MKTRLDRRTVTSTLLALVVAGAPTVATAARVQLGVQAPFDVQTGEFDLSNLAYQNLRPVFDRSFLIPYSTLEPLLANALEDVVGRTRRYYITCKLLGWDDGCPDTEITVKLHSEFRFTQEGQPQITVVGPASNNTFRIKLDLQARVGLEAEIHHETGIWYSNSEKFDMYALIGGHAAVDLKMWPIPSATNLKVELTHDGGNIHIDGLSEQIIGASMIIGAALLGPVGLALGAILGAIGADAADDAIKEEINQTISEQLNAFNPQLRELVKGQMDPVVGAAVDYRNKMMNTRIPRLDMTLAQALAVSPASIDVRSSAVNNEVRVVATTRLDPTSKGKSVSGKIRLPKTQCVYGPPIGNKTLGYTSTPIGVEPANADLVGKTCASLVNGNSVGRSVYLGESPNKLLQYPFDPANTLPSWHGAGGVSSSGNVAVKADYYECPFTVGELPAAAIFELGSVNASDLGTRLGRFAFRGRYLLMALAGPTVLLGSRGEPMNATGLVFGGKGPDTVQDCPTSHSGGTGVQKDKLGQLKDRFDPEKCPNCGLPDVFNAGDIYSQPGHEKALDRVPQMADVAKQVEKINTDLAAKAAIEGVQRIQTVLDSGLLTRSWAAVDKARAAAGARLKALEGKNLGLKQAKMKNLRVQQINVKDVGKAAARKQNVKVISGGKVLKINAQRIGDAALPRQDVEIVVTGKAGK
jgi:hypothetical protein